MRQYEAGCGRSENMCIRMCLHGKVKHPIQVQSRFTHVHTAMIGRLRLHRHGSNSYNWTVEIKSSAYLNVELQTAEKPRLRERGHGIPQIDCASICATKSMIYVIKSTGSTIGRTSKKNGVVLAACSSATLTISRTKFHYFCAQYSCTRPQTRYRA